MRDRGTEDQESSLQTLDRVTRFASENLARSMNRRAFLRRTGSGAFGLLVAFATGRGFAPRPAAAAIPGPKPPQPILTPACGPPGPYCNYQGGYPPEPNACHGAHCFQHMSNGQIVQCHIYYGFYQTGCWTTPQGGGYWTCCDCQCDTGALCGCAQYSGSPAPMPDRPAR